MQSDVFMERALSISVGSLSPTINWKTLAKEKFLLPPIPEQARSIEAFQAADAIVEELTDLLECITWVREGTITNFLEGCGDTKEFGSVIIDTSYGTSKRSNSERKGIPVSAFQTFSATKLSLDEFNTS